MYKKNYAFETHYSREATNAIAERIKRIITIPILAEKLYGDIQLSSHCLSPFRDDRHNSFGVSRDGRLWCDNATGEGGNVFHFYQKATGCDKRQAFKDLLAMAGGEVITFTPLARASSVLASPKEQFHPELDIPTLGELAQDIRDSWDRREGVGLGSQPWVPLHIHPKAGASMDHHRCQPPMLSGSTVRWSTLGAY